MLLHNNIYVFIRAFDKEPDKISRIMSRRDNFDGDLVEINIDSYFDKQTGFFTRSILCMPVLNKEGKTIGVSQVLNKRGGAFNSEDEKRLGAFTSQISMGIENAKLFDDVQNQKNYSSYTSIVSICIFSH